MSGTTSVHADRTLSARQSRPRQGGLTVSEVVDNTTSLLTGWKSCQSPLRACSTPPRLPVVIRPRREHGVSSWGVPINNCLAVGLHARAAGMRSTQPQQNETWESYQHPPPSPCAQLLKKPSPQQQPPQNRRMPPQKVSQTSSSSSVHRHDFHRDGEDQLLGEDSGGARGVQYRRELGRKHEVRARYFEFRSQIYQYV